MGSVDGRALAAGDRLRVGAAEPQGPERRQAAFLHERGPIRLLPGPQDDYFTPEALRALTEAEYTVSLEADRMGLRLQGPRLEHDARFGDGIILDGVAPGAIQVPPDGQPILLAADCQTVGGYPKIATAIRS
jgi:allophanate hydrolase subunit 2